MHAVAQESISAQRRLHPPTPPPALGASPGPVDFPSENFEQLGSGIVGPRRTRKARCNLQSTRFSESRRKPDAARALARAQRPDIARGIVCTRSSARVFSRRAPMPDAT